jgi:hypothetical protein
MASEFSDACEDILHARNAKPHCTETRSSSEKCRVWAVPANVVIIDLDAAGPLKRRQLFGQVLAVGGDPSVADDHGI